MVAIRSVDPTRDNNIINQNPPAAGQHAAQPPITRVNEQQSLGGPSRAAGPQATPQSANDAHTCCRHDSGLMQMRQRIDDALKSGTAARPPSGTECITGMGIPANPPPAGPSGPEYDGVNSRAPGQPFEALTRTEVDEIMTDVDDTGQLSDLNRLDNFRQTLTPEDQTQYDKTVNALRSDSRVEFNYKDGAQPSEALEDMALRGMVAATFNNPETLEQTLEQSGGPDGKMPIDVYPGAVPFEPYYPGFEGGAGGLALPEGGIGIDTGFMKDIIGQGDNPFVHEFSHLTQRVNPNGGEPRMNQRFPPNFSEEPGVLQAFEQPGFQQFLVDRFFGGVHPTDDVGNKLDLVHAGAETFPTLQNLFTQYPEQLQAASPEIYDAFRRYHGTDPMGRPPEVVTELGSTAARPPSGSRGTINQLPLSWVTGVM